MAYYGDNGDVKEVSNRVEVRTLDDELHDLEFDRNPATQWATVKDLRDMDALGIAPTFRRRFKFIAMVGFSSTVVVAWQNTMATFGFALFNGGTGGLFWTFIFSTVGMCLVYLTLSELASCFPTAAGQYQWVAECAPESMRRLLSYCTGWLLALSWCTYLATCAVVMGNFTKYCILLYHPDASALNSQWFPTLMSIGLLVLGALINIYLAKKFPLVEGIGLFIHLTSWAAIIVTLWVTSPRGRASEVLFTFTDGGGWGSGGVATLVGVITAWSSLMGYDSSVHMTENAKDASKTVPQSLMVSFVFNALLAFIAAITLIFCAGDTEEIQSNPNLLPVMAIFLNSTKSKAATVIMTTPLIGMALFALLSQMATASRQLWSFARDGGLPGGHHLQPVHDAETPRRAVWAVVGICSVIACVNFGPVIGFNAIISLCVVSLTFSYSICIATLLWRRSYGPPIPKERFTLGAWGPYINVGALLCAAPVTIVSVFPPLPNPPLAWMNWAIVMFGGVAILSAIYYGIEGRKHFNPPLRKLDY